MGAWHITRKELRLLVRDRRALSVLIALPLVFITILGFTTGKLLGWRQSNQVLQVAVVDEDHSDLAGQVIETLEQERGFEVRRAASRQTARRLLSDGESTVAIVIGPEFSQRVDALQLGDLLDTRRGRLAGGLSSLDIQVECKSSLRMTGKIVGRLVFGETVRTLAPHIAGKSAWAAQFLQHNNRVDKHEASEEPVPQTSQSAALSGGSIVYQQLVPSYTVMFAFFLVNIMARSFISERDQGTLRRLRIAPITPVGLLAGKTVPFLIISLIQSLLLFAFGRLLFGMSWGSQPWLLLPVIVCTSMAATTLGLLVATLVRTDSQVSAYANFLVITMAGVSGCFIPRDWLPGTMQQISLVTPHAWSLIAYEQILAVETIHGWVVVQSCSVLLAFSLLFFLLGCWRFGKLS